MSKATTKNIIGESVEDRARREDIEKRKAAGALGNLWGVEILFNNGITPGSVRRHTIKNLFGAELMQLRESIFTTGVLLPQEPGHWKIIKPADIMEIDVWRQKSFFD